MLHGRPPILKISLFALTHLRGCLAFLSSGTTVWNAVGILAIGCTGGPARELGNGGYLKPGFLAVPALALRSPVKVCPPGPETILMDDEAAVGAMLLLTTLEGDAALFVSVPAAKFEMGFGLGSIGAGVGVSALIAVDEEGDERAAAVLPNVAGVRSAGGSS